MPQAIMLNRTLSFQTLVAILALAAPAGGDPPGAWADRVQTFRDWRLDCRDGPCSATTAVTGADGSEVLRLAVAGPEPGRSLTIGTALPLFLPDGMTLAIGEEPDRAVAWRTCGPGGCDAVVPVDPALLAALKRERSGRATFTLVDGVKVRLPFSLLGFTAALEAGERAVSRAP
jgi:invasion protein IalB